MKITRLESFLTNSGLRNYLFVRLTTDSGLTGLGEASLEWQEKTVETLVHEWVEDRILGVDPFDVEQVVGNLIRDQKTIQIRSSMQTGKAHGMYLLEQSLNDLVAKGRITREQLHKLSITTAGERLRVEEELEEVDRRIQDQTDASERTRGRQKALAILLDGWDEQPVEEKQQHLREMLDRVVVRDEGIELVLRP